MIRFAGFLLLAASGYLVASAQTKLPTVDEAFELSANTGRPIFAMAGQQT